MVPKDVRRCGLYVPKDALQILALWPLKNSLEPIWATWVPRA